MFRQTHLVPAGAQVWMNQVRAATKAGTNPNALRDKRVTSNERSHSFMVVTSADPRTRMFIFFIFTRNVDTSRFPSTHTIHSDPIQFTQVVAARGSRFAYASTLALYVHNDDDFSLSEIAATQTATIVCFDWHCTHQSAWVVATNDDVVKVYTDGQMKHTLKFPSFGVKFLSWDQHRADTFLCVAGSSMHKVKLNVGGSGSTSTQKVPWANTGIVTCFTRHPTNNRQVCAGTKTGSVWLHDTENGKSIPLHRLFEGEIASVAFDPKSFDYLLVATKNGVITLWSVDKSGEAGVGVSTACKPTQVMEFTKQQTGLSSVIWIPNSPGSFITASEKHGVLRVWNVSNETHVHTINASEGAVSSVCALTDDSGRVAVSFKSGEVCVFSTKHRRKVWAKGPGHTETVFACVYNPLDANQVVSCSFDGTVRVWNARVQRCTKTFHTADAPRVSGERGVSGSEGFGGGERKFEPGKGSLYTCAVSCDGKIVCAAGFEGDLYFFDVVTGRALPPVDIAPRRDGCVHKVVAHPTRPGVFACASLDGRAHVMHYSGRIFISIQHGTPVVGVGFDPFDETVLATATAGGWVGMHCAPGGFFDGNSEGNSQPVTCVSTKLGASEGGHSSKVYGVLFSPLVPGRMLSVSDDCTARVWSVTQQTSGKFVCVDKTVTLKGHSDKVRAQNWHPEIKNVCFTGSWDGSIRSWDVTLGVCLQVTTTHLADVYDIGVHADRPFNAVTCSRDTTMRFWSTEDMAPSAKLLAVLGAEVTQAHTVGVADHSETHESRGTQRSSSRTLSGPTVGGGALHRAVAGAPTPCHKHGYIFSALSGYASCEEMWRLARIEQSGAQAARTKEDDANGAVATPHACEARDLVEARVADTAGTSGSRRSRRDEETDTRENASVKLRLGDVHSYCEAMKELGEWDAAISAAPAVSLEYWASLLGKRAVVIARDGGDVDEASRILLAAGRSEEACAALVHAGREDDAFVVACTANAGGFPKPPPSGPSNNSFRDYETTRGDGAHERNESAPDALLSSFQSDESSDETDEHSDVLRKLNIRSASVDFGSLEEDVPASPFATKLPPLSPLGVSKSGSSLASLSPLPPLRVAGKMKLLAKQVKVKSENELVGKGREAVAPPAAPEKSSKSLQTSSSAPLAENAPGRLIRLTQASRRLAHGDAVGAASSFLSIGDACGAVRALLRGTQVEMAAALMLSLPAKSWVDYFAESEKSKTVPDAAQSLLATRACEFGEWDLALESCCAISDPYERAWWGQLVLAKRFAVDPEGCVEDKFAEKCKAGCGKLVNPTNASPATNAATTAVAAAVVGDVQAAAECAVAAALVEVSKVFDVGMEDGGKFGDRTSNLWDSAGLTKLLSAFEIISTARNADAYDPKLRVEVTTFRCYLGALVLHSAGYTPAQRSLFHHARASLKSSKAFTRFPHQAAFISLQELSVMQETYPVDAAEGLTEISTAAAVSPALRNVASDILNVIAVKDDVSDKAPPPLASLSLDSKYNGVVDWAVADKMPMEDALRCAAIWDAAGLVDSGAFKPPV